MLYRELTHIEYLACVELDAKFDDNSTSIGSGFIVGDADSLYICTARHVLDPKYRPQNDGYRNAIITECHVRIRIHKQAGSMLNYQPYELGVPNPQLLFDDRDHDVCAIKVPKANISFKNGFELTHFEYAALANQSQIAQYSASTPAYIIGYPKTAPPGQKMASGRHERMPVIRQGILATIPALTTSVNGAIGSDYGYLDCYALNGFSGGPVIVPEYGIEKKPGRLIATEIFRPTQIVGMLCGHLRSSDDRAEGKHSGLSYYCSSNTLIRLLDQNR
ncbi:MAG: serine protease [Henriciella sp.]